MRKREIEEGILRMEKFKQGDDRRWIEERIGQRERSAKIKDVCKSHIQMD